jgi:hypothetical protein
MSNRKPADIGEGAGTFKDFRPNQPLQQTGPAQRHFVVRYHASRPRC